MRLICTLVCHKNIHLCDFTKESVIASNCIVALLSPNLMSLQNPVWTNPFAYFWRKCRPRISSESRTVVQGLVLSSLCMCLVETWPLEHSSVPVTAEGYSVYFISFAHQDPSTQCVTQCTCQILMKILHGVRFLVQLGLLVGQEGQVQQFHLVGTWHLET